MSPLWLCRSGDADPSREPRPAARRDGSAPTVALILVIGLLSTLGPASTDMYLPALPAMTQELGGGSVGAQATLGAFLVGMGVGQLVYGPLSDRVGRRPPLLFGIALFLIGTAGCTVATSINVLVVARFVVQGLLALTLVLWLFRRFDESRPEAARLLARGETVLRSLVIILREPRIMSFVLCGAFNAVVFFTYLVSAPGLLLGTYGIVPRDFGWVFAVNAIGFILVNQLNVRLLRHYPPLTILRRARLPTILAGVVLVFDALSGSFGVLGILIPLFFCLSSAGLIGPNALACALSVDSVRAGTISSISGAAAFVLGAFASTLTGHVQDGTPRPMAVIILAGMLASTFALFAVALPIASQSTRSAA